MLSQFKHLSDATEGRYATDGELQFIVDYANSYALRLKTYKKLQTLERTIVEEVRDRMMSIDPTLLQRGDQSLAGKWKQDTLRVFRYSAVALLLDDPALHRERFLVWFQTIMRAFGAQRSCDVTYTVMRDVITSHLTAAEAELMLPIIELNRSALGMAA